MEHPFLMGSVMALAMPTITIYMIIDLIIALITVTVFVLEINAATMFAVAPTEGKLLHKTQEQPYPLPHRALYKQDKANPML